MPSTDIVLGDLVANVRDIIGESSPIRFGPDFMGRAATAACRQLSLDIDHPYGRAIFDVTSVQREFQLPSLTRILRIYMHGPDGSEQLLIPTDIPTLNGEIQETYDNRSSWNQGAPPQTPNWLVQQSEPYPVIPNQVGGRVPTKSQWYPSSRPSYYLFGGDIGFTIPPAVTSPVTQVYMEYVIQHPVVSNDNDPILFPGHCAEALTYYMVHRCWMSDNLDKAEEAMMRYRSEVKRMNLWSERLQGGKEVGFVPVTRRRSRGEGWFR